MAHDINFTPAYTCQKFMSSDAKMRVLMGPVGCIAGDTLVITEEGAIPISDIDRPTRVLSWNEKRGRFELSLSGGAFPKGRDYLYRVTTQQGEFVAAGFHLVLCADGSYQRVDTLAPGQSVSQCFAHPQEIALGRVPLMSHASGPGYLRTIAGSLGRCADSARLYGQQFLLGASTGQASALVQGGALGLLTSYAPVAAGQRGGPQAQLPARNHLSPPYGQIETGGSSHPAAPPPSNGEARDGAALYQHIAAQLRRGLRSLRKSGSRLITRLSSLCLRSYQYSISDRTIISVKRLDVKQPYWDLQVLDTNNYVTADGMVHHNSSKSVTSCFEVIRRATAQEPNKQGIRKSRAAVVRETARQLADTTIKTFLDWFPPGVCGTYMRTTKTFFFKVGDVECEVMFRALDDADDVANLNSLELTFAWFNECRDIHPDIIDAMSKRVGRFPSKKDGGPTWFGMWGDTNPPTMDSWWYYNMEHLDPKDGVSPNDNGWAVFKQPSGRSEYAENLENLPDGYYTTQGRSEEYIRVYIDGDYGLSSAGQPIYKYFRPDYHMADGPLSPISNGMRPVVIGVDLGLTPAAVFGQLCPRGRALILAEAVSFDMGVQRFVRTVLKPLIFEKFSGAPIMVVVDPAGVQRAQTDERSAVDIIKAEGLKVMPAKTNNPTARIGAVDDFLMRHADGDSAFTVDPSCMALKSAMMGGYRYHMKTGAIEKNKHSHVAEALQYLMLHLASISDGAVVAQRRDIKPHSSLGWT